MTIYENTRSMTSTNTGEWAERTAGPDGSDWQLSWLPGAVLTREQAYAGLALAELITGTPGADGDFGTAGTAGKSGTAESADATAREAAAAYAAILGIHLPDAVILLHRRELERRQP